MYLLRWPCKEVARLNAAWLVIRMAKFTKSPMHLALSVISEAHAQRYLKECQGMALQKVQMLIPTTSMLYLHCAIELVELHPSDNREEALHQECIHMRNVTPHHQENCAAAFLFAPKGRSH